MRRTLVVAIVLFDLTAALVLWLGQNAVRTVERRSAPGLLDALAVRAALADADQAAWASFLTGSAALVGPGAVFENDIATAGRHLEHLAELATTSSGELLTISGQLLTYQSLVERADASYRAGLAAGRQELAFAWLTAASKPLHESGGLLAGVDRLVTSSQETNDGQARSWWTGSAVLFLPLVAALSLLAGLVRFQLMFRRLFRRAVNPALAVAMALTVALSVWLGVVAVHTDRAFGDAQRRVLPALVGQWEGQIRSADEW
jgi:hypothetical protein